MRAVVQRCLGARILVEGQERASIGPGLVVFLGIGRGDTSETGRSMAERIFRLRAFEDGEGRMNLALSESGGAVLLVPQFTVMGDLRRGHRPSFHEAAEPQTAEGLWRFVGESLARMGVPVAYGVFGARMEVQVRNDGPVTLLLSSDRAF